MRNWIIVACALLLFAGCSKYTTPRKVEKRITEGSWTITTFTIDGESVTLNYLLTTFAFAEDGDIAVKGAIVANGHWEVGLNKNPAILYLSFPPVDGLEYLADDWQVVEMKKNLMRLKRNDDNGANSTLVFKK